jgi:hypothetical protein
VKKNGVPEKNEDQELIAGGSMIRITKGLNAEVLKIEDPERTEGNRHNRDSNS